MTLYYTFFCHLKHFLVTTLIKIVGTLPCNHFTANAVAAVQSFLAVMKKLTWFVSVIEPLIDCSFLLNLNAFWHVSSGP